MNISQGLIAGYRLLTQEDGRIIAARNDHTSALIVVFDRIQVATTMTCRGVNKSYFSSLYTVRWADSQRGVFQNIGTRTIRELPEALRTACERHLQFIRSK